MGRGVLIFKHQVHQKYLTFHFHVIFSKKIKHYGKTFGKQSGSNYSRSSRDW